MIYHPTLADRLRDWFAGFTILSQGTDPDGNNYVVGWFTPMCRELVGILMERLLKEPLWPAREKPGPGEAPSAIPQGWGAYLVRGAAWSMTDTVPRGFAVFKEAPDGTITIPGVALLMRGDPVRLIDSKIPPPLESYVFIAGLPSFDESNPTDLIVLLARAMLDYAHTHGEPLVYLVTDFPTDTGALVTQFLGHPANEVCRIDPYADHHKVVIVSIDTAPPTP